MLMLKSSEHIFVFVFLEVFVSCLVFVFFFSLLGFLECVWSFVVYPFKGQEIEKNQVACFPLEIRSYYTRIRLNAPLGVQNQIQLRIVFNYY